MKNNTIETNDVYSQKLSDLNKAVLEVEDGPNPYIEDSSITTGNVQCYFRNIKEQLIKKIEEYPLVFGCVAWVTDKDILAALAKKEAYHEGTAIVVQKEDFLRPDGRNDMAVVRELYEEIKENCNTLERSHFPFLCQMSQCYDPSIGIRCVGNHNSNKSPTMPKSHHKFLVFGRFKNDKWLKKLTPEDVKDMGGIAYDDFGLIKPEAVWTGSFNFTETSVVSLENAVFIKDSKTAKAYMNEFEQVVSISEPLDWKHKWVTPEYRIGS